ncbi:hypothetical protein [Spirillospora sp. NPDC029432]|uniref:hypothetical protein n=1 Tax=Spirillospora sp. NPDC029432 TaxID=3154599 RepID=UPI0034520B4E
MTRHPASLRLSPSRRPWIVVAPLVAAAPALAAGAQGLRIHTDGREPELHAIGTALLFAALGLTLACVRSLLITFSGFTEAWPDGLYNQLIGRVAEVTWERVDRLEVIPTLFGRYVQVVHHDGSRISLAAPRTGLFMRGADFDQHLTALRTCPGGGRSRLPVEHRSRHLVHFQLFLMLIFATTILAMAVR